MHPIRIHRHALRVAAAAALSAVAAACSDGANPLGNTKPGIAPAHRSPLEVLDCTLATATGSVRCVPVAAHGGAAADLLLGGSYVQLASSNASYDGGTELYTVDVTVKNLIQQPIGTSDGTTVDGVRVFFASGPYVTSGTGSVDVIPDGTGTFTATNQPYYAYGEILAQNQVSAAHTWTFSIPPTVASFAFTVYVDAPARFESGYVDLDGHVPGAGQVTLAASGTHALTATDRTAVGAEVTGSTLTFSSSDPSVATVDSGGTITAIAAGSCTVTATSSRGTAGSIAVTVTP